MILALEVLGVLTMCTIMFVSIWGFIIMKQMLSQLKYRNYLVEKLTQYMYFLTKKDDGSLTKPDNNKKE
jgi:biopolymer transport protein ExbB/TolQ